MARSARVRDVSDGRVQFYFIFTVRCRKVRFINAGFILTVCFWLQPYFSNFKQRKRIPAFHSKSISYARTPAVFKGSAAKCAMFLSEIIQVKKTH